MKSLETKVTRVIVGKIEPGEDLLDSIINLVKKFNIKSGFVKCIGALKTFTIGFYILNSKEYKMKTFNENVELISCMGNIAFKNGEPIIHLHVSLGRGDYSVIGGHLSKPSIVSVTGEVSIFEIEQKLNRVNDPQFGLSLLEL
ncbi:MAG: DNA-binding protein [Candidatus Lokiarchaeota archaeon]|nr:DNA-binding protein [Candidatus Lokiarchaeota archaeon]